MTTHPGQLGFDALLQDADAQNAANAFARETAHLPDTWEDALAFHHQHIVNHHAAMLAADFEAAMSIRKEAHLLAKKLNGGDPGILASDDAPGCRLDTQAGAIDGAIPFWGQRGAFVLELARIKALAQMEGMFGIGATAMPYLGFSVRAVDRSKPFLSSTGYRSFLGCSVSPEPGMTTEGFMRRVIEAYVAQDLHGELLHIDPKWSK